MDSRIFCSIMIFLNFATDLELKKILYTLFCLPLKKFKYV